jgi:branched-chain amino acid transport system ATP-binding protein
VTALLTIDRLSRRFGALVAVEDLSFSVAEGEILGIIGPNGAGKTTVVNLITGLYTPDTGNVTFRGEDITGVRMDLLVRRGLVRTFQATTVYQEQSVRENVLRGAFTSMYPGFWPAFLHTGGARAKQRAAVNLADDLLDQLGLTAVADVEARNLPYGHQKTLGLALALAAKPKLVMLDEPAAGLNHEEASQILAVIKRVNATGVSVVVIDHNMRFISTLCHRIVVVHHGSKIAEGTPDTVMRDTAVIEAYLGTKREPA